MSNRETFEEIDRLREEEEAAMLEYDLGNVRAMVEKEIDRAVKNRLEDIDDIVNNPKHYTSGSVECIDAIRSALGDDDLFVAYCEGNVIKYIWRFRHKGGLVDLKKAKWYLDLMTCIENQGKRKEEEQDLQIKSTEPNPAADISENAGGSLAD